MSKNTKSKTARAVLMKQASSHYRNDNIATVKLVRGVFSRQNHKRSSKIHSNRGFELYRYNEIRETYANKADRKPHYTQLNKEMYELKWHFLSLKCEKSVSPRRGVC